MKHTLKGISATRQVWLDGEELDPKPSLVYRNHSPDGFAWGYGGSGPAQLALAILLHLGKENEIHYQRFKQMVIAKLPMDQDFEIEFEL